MTHGLGGVVVHPVVGLSTRKIAPWNESETYRFPWLSKAKAFGTRAPPPNLIVSAETVAQAVIRILENKQFEVVLPRSLALMSAVKRHWPNLFRAIAHRRFQAHVVLPEKSSSDGDAGQESC
jgi:hypothetical protein